MTIEQIRKIRLHFIVSTARTGSTLLSSMFNMHKNIVSPVEEPFAYNLHFKYHSVKNWTAEVIDKYCYDFFLFSEGVLESQFGTKSELREMLIKYKDGLDYYTAVKITYLCFLPEKDKSQITTIIDKQLKFHDFLEDVARFFPESKFIILTRDPRDNALVKMKRIIREGAHKNSFGRKNNYYHLALDWNREYSLLNAKKEKIGAERFMQLRYEDLVADPEKELKRIAAFLDFGYDPQMLEYHSVMKQNMEKGIELNDIKKQHFYSLHESLTKSVNKEKVDVWKSQLSEKDAAVIWDICSEQASQMGYEHSGRSSSFRKGIGYYIAYLKYLLLKILVPEIYYGVPFFMRYLVKKIKYGRAFKQDQYTSEKFREKAK